jgi:hypothetical protein
MDRTFTQKKIGTELNTTKNDKQNDFSHQPGNDVVSVILNYSKSLIVKQSTMVNQVELLLN